MAKRKRSKPLKLASAPLLLTDVRSGEWQGGVFMLNVRSGDVAGTLALGPHALLRLLESAKRAALDNAAPFNRTRPDPAHPVKLEEAKP